MHTTLATRAPHQKIHTHVPHTGLGLASQKKVILTGGCTVHVHTCRYTDVDQGKIIIILLCYTKRIGLTNGGLYILELIAAKLYYLEHHRPFHLHCVVLLHVYM